MRAGVWVDGECVGVVSDDGRPYWCWPSRPDTSFDSLVAYESQEPGEPAMCRREFYPTPMRGGFWTTTPVYVDGERSKVAIVNGIAALRACSLS